MVFHGIENFSYPIFKENYSVRIDNGKFSIHKSMITRGGLFSTVLIFLAFKNANHGIKTIIYVKMKR